MGITEDTPNRSKLAKLLRFKTSISEDRYRSLEEYIEDMPAWQSDIYFISGESLEAVKKSPFMESANRKKIEVVFLTEPVDECQLPFRVRHISGHFFLIQHRCISIFGRVRRA